MRALAARLPPGLPATVAYQSRVGPVKWMEPFLDAEVRRLGASGCKKLILFPITFVSEHLETLWELDIFIRGLARAAGIAEFVRVPTVRDHPTFIELLKKLVNDALRSS
jgi:ferrochelatase